MQESHACQGAGSCILSGAKEKKEGYFWELTVGPEIMNDNLLSIEYMVIFWICMSGSNRSQGGADLALFGGQIINEMLQM